SAPARRRIRWWRWCATRSPAAARRRESSTLCGRAPLARIGRHDVRLGKRLGLGDRVALVEQLRFALLPLSRVVALRAVDVHELAGAVVEEDLALPDLRRVPPDDGVVEPHLGVLVVRQPRCAAVPEHEGDDLVARRATERGIAEQTLVER